MNNTINDIISDTDARQKIRETLISGKQLTDAQIEYVAALFNLADVLDNQTENNCNMTTLLKSTGADYRLRLPQRLKYAQDAIGV